MVHSRKHCYILPLTTILYLEPLLNGAFSNDSFKELLLNNFVIFLGLTFAFLLPLIIFAPTDCPSHCSLIPIQRSKNKNLKTKIPQITNHFSSIFIYKKRKEKRDRRNKNRNSIISTSNGHNF
jgi:hypothetical protein